MEVGLLGGALHDHVVGEPGPGVSQEQLLHVHGLGCQVGLAQVVDVERHLVLDLHAKQPLNDSPFSLSWPLSEGQCQSRGALCTLLYVCWSCNLLDNRSRPL